MKTRIAVVLALVAWMLGAPTAKADIVIPTTAAIVYGDNGIQTGPIKSVPNLYGWKWGGQVQVFDGTPQPNNWRIAEAVQEWTKGGINAVMTTDQSQAEIVITEEYDQCGYTGAGVVLGCSYLPASTNGIAFGVSTIHLTPGWNNRPMSEHVASHEIGHSIGLAHYYGNGRSIMKPEVNDSNYLTRPTAYDIRDVRFLYGRTS